MVIGRQLLASQFELEASAVTIFDCASMRRDSYSSTLPWNSADILCISFCSVSFSSSLVCRLSIRSAAGLKMPPMSSRIPMVVSSRLVVLRRQSVEGIETLLHPGPVLLRLAGPVVELREILESVLLERRQHGLGRRDEIEEADDVVADVLGEFFEHVLDAGE